MNTLSLEILGLILGVMVLALVHYLLGFVVLADVGLHNLAKVRLA